MKMYIYLCVFVLLICFVGLLYNTNKLYEKDSDKGYRLVLALVFFMVGIFSLAILNHLL